jgi:hypothetical protein
MVLETVAARFSGTLLARDWSPIPLIRLIDKYQGRVLRWTAALPFDWTVVRAAAMRINVISDAECVA